MSISNRRKNDYNKGEEQRKTSFALAGISGTYIFALTLLASIISAFISPTQMISTTAFAQEEENDITADGTIANEMTTTTTTGNTSTPTTPSSGLKLSPQPIWDEQATTSGITPINETHSIVTFIGNGTMTVPHNGETINMTNNGTAFISPVPGYADTVSAYGREHVFSEDGDSTAITFYEIVRYDPTTFEGKGLVIAVFDRNATGSLAPFNGMIVVGIHEEDPNTQAATIILWEWQSGIPLLPAVTAVEESPPIMKTTIEDEGEQQQTTPTILAPLQK
jgi:hypothetical protein